MDSGKSELSKIIGLTVSGFNSTGGGIAKSVGGYLVAPTCGNWLDGGLKAA